MNETVPVCCVQLPQPWPWPRHHMVCVAKCVRPVTHLHTLKVTFLRDKRVSYDVTPPEPRDWLQVKKERFLLVV